ncbi:MAG: hypothetical protein IJD37_07050 [Clostridia bacterium]|nr:hypothetical protein [Clostridia bacterium]
MAKKKHRKRRSFVPESEAKNAVKKSFAEFNWKLFGKLILSFIIIFSLYQLGLKLGELYNPVIITVVVVTYVIATTVLAAAFIIMNRGISNDIPTKEQLNDNMSDEEKEKFIADLIESRKKAKKILLVLIPLIFTLLFDMLYLFFLVK